MLKVRLHVCCIWQSHGQLCLQVCRKLVHELECVQVITPCHAVTQCIHTSYHAVTQRIHTSYHAVTQRAHTSYHAATQCIHPSYNYNSQTFSILFSCKQRLKRAQVNCITLECMSMIDYDKFNIMVSNTNYTVFQKKFTPRTFMITV